MNYPITPKPPNSGNPAITILRIVLWLLPAFILPFVIVLHNLWLGRLAIFGWVAVVGAAGLIGYFDQRLCLQQKRIEASEETENPIHGAVLFVILQCLIAPLIDIALLYGYCMVTGFNI